ncbi:MAG: hypothetical protein ACK5UB_14300 [Pseudanabaena sp.]|jgi:hypothetical protein
MIKYIALIYIIVSSIVIIFQIALVFGAPWGNLTLGGKWRGRLPGKARIIPFFSIVVLLFFIIIAAARTQIAFDQIYDSSKNLIWIVVGYNILGTIMNAITPSRSERKLWLPVIVFMLLSSIFIAFS